MWCPVLFDPAIYSLPTLFRLYVSPLSLSLSSRPATHRPLSLSIFDLSFWVRIRSLLLHLCRYVSLFSVVRVFLWSNRFAGFFVSFLWIPGCFSRFPEGEFLFGYILSFIKHQIFKLCSYVTFFLFVFLKCYFQFYLQTVIMSSSVV